MIPTMSLHVVDLRSTRIVAGIAGVVKREVPRLVSVGGLITRAVGALAAHAWADLRRLRTSGGGLERLGQLTVSGNDVTYRLDQLSQRCCINLTQRSLPDIQILFV